MSTERRVEACFFMRRPSTRDALARGVPRDDPGDGERQPVRPAADEGAARRARAAPRSSEPHENLAFYKAVRAAKNAAPGDGAPRRRRRTLAEGRLRLARRSSSTCRGLDAAAFSRRWRRSRRDGGGGAAWAAPSRRRRRRYSLMERDTCAARAEPAHGVVCHTLGRLPLTPRAPAPRRSALPPWTRRRSTSSSPPSSRRPTPGRRRRHLLRVPRVGAVAAVGLPILRRREQA